MDVINHSLAAGHGRFYLPIAASAHANDRGTQQPLVQPVSQPENLRHSPLRVRAVFDDRYRLVLVRIERLAREELDSSDPVLGERGQ